MDLSSSTRGHLPPTGPELRQESNNRIEWSKLSTEEMRVILRPMRSDVLEFMFEMMGPEEKCEFSKRMARFRNEEVQEHAKIGAILEMAKSLAGLEDFQGRVHDAEVTSNAPQPSFEASVEQSVTVVTPDASRLDVTPKTPQNRHDVTVVAPAVMHYVAPYSVAVRAKRGEDGLFHCMQCEYATKRSGTLRMHRHRRHRNLKM